MENAIKDYSKKQLKNAAKELAKMQFNDLPSEEEWLEIQSKI